MVEGKQALETWQHPRLREGGFGEGGVTNSEVRIFLRTQTQIVS